MHQRLRSSCVLRLAVGPWPLAALLIAGCATLSDQGQSLVPTKYQTRTGPYAVYTNFAMPADAPAIRQLQALDRQVQAALGVPIEPGEHPVEVYILGDRKAFNHFLTFYYPELPPRRAFFLGQGDRRVVYTFLGDRLEEDLRHEATHALLNVAAPGLPLWLDEGLAEYFEAPNDATGLNAEHVGRLPQDRAEGWTPDLARLEALKDVRQMSPRDYREAWAWVHYLLNGPTAGKTELTAYLADLRQTHDAASIRPLSDRLHVAGPRLLAHLDTIAGQPIAASHTAATPAPHDPTIRLQSTAGSPSSSSPSSASSPAEPAKRKSLLSRFLGLFSSHPERKTTPGE